MFQIRLLNIFSDGRSEFEKVVRRFVLLEMKRMLRLCSIKWNLRLTPKGREKVSKRLADGWDRKRIADE